MVASWTRQGVQAAYVSSRGGPEGAPGLAPLMFGKCSDSFRAPHEVSEHFPNFIQEHPY